MSAPQHAERDIRYRFGRNVAAARVHAGLTQEDLAKRLRVHPSYISLIEAGRRNAGIVLIERVSLALGVEIATLLTADRPFPEPR